MLEEVAEPWSRQRPGQRPLPLRYSGACSAQVNGWTGQPERGDPWRKRPPLVVRSHDRNPPHSPPIAERRLAIQLKELHPSKMTCIRYERQSLSVERK